MSLRRTRNYIHQRRESETEFPRTQNSIKKYVHTLNSYVHSKTDRSLTTLCCWIFICFYKLCCLCFHIFNRCRVKVDLLEVWQHGEIHSSIFIVIMDLSDKRIPSSAEYNLNYKVNGLMHALLNQAHVTKSLRLWFNCLTQFKYQHVYLPAAE